MTNDAVARCPNLWLRFFNPFGKPLAEASVAIESAQRQTFITDGFGGIAYHETSFPPEGKIFIEYIDGGKHLSWSSRLPDKPGSYDIYLNVWTNDPDGRE